ncbi:hypothetical protein C0J52_22673 [Blattella germanica]|nr:hypothetical protein C0J52_22673 [Blattella germanica]
MVVSIFKLKFYKPSGGISQTLLYETTLHSLQLNRWMKMTAIKSNRNESPDSTHSLFLPLSSDSSIET